MKRWILALLCLLSLTVTACNGKEADTETDAQGGAKQSLRIEDINESGKLLPLTEIKFYGQEEEQTYWNSYVPHSMAKGKQGYYFASFGMGNNGLNSDQVLLLGHVSEDGTRCIPVCSDARCGHTEDDCSAYFQDYEAQIWYYRDSLYTVKRSNGNAVLVRLKPDGGDRQELFEIGAVPVDGASGTRLVFCDDCVYAYDNRTNLMMGIEYGTGIRKRSLDGKTDEEIITSREISSGFNNARSYGGNVFFIYHTYTYDSENQSAWLDSKGMYCYDTHTGAVNRVLDVKVSDYAIDTEKKLLYCYVMFEGLYAYDLTTGERKLLYEAEETTQICHLSYDGTYLYLDNQQGVYYIDLYAPDTLRKITVLDKEGTKVNEIGNLMTRNVLFGDERMLFVFAGAVYDHEIGPRGEGDYVNFGPAYIKKEQIGTATEFSLSVWP